MRKFALSAVALFAMSAPALAQTVPTPSVGQVTIGSSGINGLQLQGGLNTNGQTDFVGGSQPGMVESGSGSVFTTGTTSLAVPSLSNISATTSGTTVGNQTSQISDTNIASNQTAWTSNDVFGESVTSEGLTTGVPDLTSSNTVGWDK
jgi:hypothetical protein